jgi:hypothetical protein
MRETAKHWFRLRAFGEIGGRGELLPEKPVRIDQTKQEVGTSGIVNQNENYYSFLFVRLRYYGLLM